MTVYAIHALGTDFVKIGYTRASDDAQRRLQELQTNSPHPLAVMALIPDAPVLVENMFHRMLEALHVRGEWFRLDREERSKLIGAFVENTGYKQDLEQNLMRKMGLTSKQSFREYFEVVPWVNKYAARKQARARQGQLFSDYELATQLEKEHTRKKAGIS